MSPTKPCPQQSHVQNPFPEPPGPTDPEVSVLPQKSWRWGPAGYGAILLVNCDRDGLRSRGLDLANSQLTTLDGERQKGPVVLSRVMVCGGKGSERVGREPVSGQREACLKGAPRFRPERHVPNGADLRRPRQAL